MKGNSRQTALGAVVSVEHFASSATSARESQLDGW